MGPISVLGRYGKSPDAARTVVTLQVWGIEV
jgi:hypothetical protein